MSGTIVQVTIPIQAIKKAEEKQRKEAEKAQRKA